MKTHNLGLNIVGYTDSVSGLGEAVKLNIEAARKIDIDVDIINYEKVKLGTDYKYNFQYSINLVQIAINDLDTFFSIIDSGFFKNRYSILFLLWESEYVPPKFKETIILFNEIWTASLYCKSIINKVYNGPVIVMPHPVEISLKPIKDQKQFIFSTKINLVFYLFLATTAPLKEKIHFFWLMPSSKHLARMKKSN
ncbi:hypothetical protein [Gelidibacter algens]|uniref:hypothetical protein n=1 Tax=Gelidibacter algens TaxID=49280 RepID=UPI00200FD3A0|nr:hypothetical protein [Gelidibacter algens]